MIQTTSLMHGSIPYHYRTHSGKVDALQDSQFSALCKHLKRLHNNCPTEPFEDDPRASTQRFHHRYKLDKHLKHDRSKWTLKGLEVYAEKYKTPHSRVGCWMIENDPCTFAIEVPVWMEAKEVGVPLIPSDSGKWLSGHIDLLSFENGALWIWDFKPHADREVWAVGQLTLYARMLAYQTGIPIANMMCGYFDSEECFTFAPDLSRLDMAPQEAARERDAGSRPPRPVVSKEKRLAQKPPDLSKLGVRKPHVSLTETEFYTWYLFVNQRKSIGEISEIRQISEDAVLTHFSSMIRLKVVPWEKVLEPAVRTQVLKAFKKLGANPEQPLKGTFEALNGQVGYGLIRCALASQ